MKRRYSSRRTFLAVATATTVPLTAAPLQFFSAAEAELLAAICEQIIPTDRDPGAKEAGVVQYIDLQLMGPLKRFGSAYRYGLSAIAKETDFLALDAASRVAYLQQLERGNARAFFAMVVDHAMQGFYGSPKHGGNQGAVSWKMLGVREHLH